MSNGVVEPIKIAKKTTTLAIPYRGNVVQDLIKTEGKAHIVLSDFVRNSAIFGSNKPRLYGVGNCGEHSMDLYSELITSNINLPIFRVSYPNPNTDHAFNLVGDPRIQHPYIADTWSFRDDIVPLWNERNISLFPEKTSLFHFPSTNGMSFGPSALNIYQYSMPNSKLPSPQKPIMISWDTLGLEDKMRSRLQSSMISVNGLSNSGVRNRYVEYYKTPGVRNMWSDQLANGSDNKRDGLFSAFTNSMFKEEFHEVQFTSGSILDKLFLPSPYDFMQLYKVKNPVAPPVMFNPVFPVPQVKMLSTKESVSPVEKDPFASLVKEFKKTL